MELNRHDCVAFGIGAAVGGLLAWAGSYIFFRKEREENLQMILKQRRDMVVLQEENSHLNARNRDLNNANLCLMQIRDKLLDTVDKIDDIPTQVSDTGRDKGVLSRQQRDDIRKKLEKNYEGTTNYAKQYVGKMEPGEDKSYPMTPEEDVHTIYDDIEAELAEREHPEDDEPYVDPRDQEDEGDISTTLPESSKDADVDEFFREHQKKKGRKPRIISVEEAANLPEYIETMTLFYYATNDVVVTEDEEVVEDPERIIGDALTKYDFANNDEMRIFVMNYSLDTCYEISKILGSYEVD